MNFGKSLSLKKKISILILIVGIIAVIFNFCVGFFVKDYSIVFLLSHPSINTILMGILVISISSKYFPRIEPIMQIGILFMVSFFGIMSDYNNFYGIGQIILALILMYKYGYLEKRIRMKFFLVSIFFIGSIEFSIFMSNRPEGGVGIEVLIYTAFFIYFLFLVYQDEIEEYISRHKMVSGNVDILQKERLPLTTRIKKLEKEKKELDERIQYSLKVGEKVDLNKFDLTKSEINVVRILINDRKSNKEIADELFVSESTIKTHLNNIYKKVGVKSRGELIGMFNHIEIM
jgi:DNA-binding CsgD family transcriptional regulator